MKTLPRSIKKVSDFLCISRSLFWQGVFTISVVYLLMVAAFMLSVHSGSGELAAKIIPWVVRLSAVAGIWVGLGSRSASYAMSGKPILSKVLNAVGSYCLVTGMAFLVLSAFVTPSAIINGISWLVTLVL